MKDFIIIFICSCNLAFSFVSDISMGKLTDMQKSNFEQIQTIKSELAYHEKYLQALDVNATSDRIRSKQTKEIVDFIYNGLGGDKHLGGWE